MLPAYSIHFALELIQADCPSKYEAKHSFVPEMLVMPG